MERGSADASEGHTADDFDKWSDLFWAAVSKEYGVSEGQTMQSQGLDIEIETDTRVNHLRQDLGEGLVLDNRVLTALDEPAKRHIEIQLPTGMGYTAGDYLAVLPVNNDKTVKAVNG